MLIVLLIVITLVAMIAGRLILNCWFNHLSIYSGIWGSMLILVESRLIAYNPISGIAWLYIFSAWLALYLGSLTVLGVRGRTSRKSGVDDGQSVLQLRTILWWFSFVGSIAIAAQVLAVVGEFGTLTDAIFGQGNALYHARLDNPELSGISYLGAFPLAACTLAGIYTARIGKLTITALMPLVLVTLAGVIAMGRAGIMFAAIWFVVAFAHTPRPRFKIQKWQAAVAVVLVMAVLFAGISIISQTRGLDTDFSGLSPAVEQMSEYFPTLPSLLFDFSGPAVGFSDYLAHPKKNAAAFWGMYTFAPMFRLFSRLGAHTAVPGYEEDYYTPRDVNVMTYLKNIHSDFGGAGVLLFPYLLGALMTWLKLKLDEGFDLLYVVFLTHGYLIVIFSFAYLVTFLGVWYFSLALGLAVCYRIKRRGSSRSIRSLSTRSLKVSVS